MKKSSFILAVLMALTMAGCQEVPDDVKSRTEEKNSAIEEAKNNPERTGEIKFISPSELKADIEAGLSQTYSNFTLAEGIKVDVPETFIKCDFKQVSGFDEKGDMLFERFFGKEIAGEFSLEDNLSDIDGVYSSAYKSFRDDTVQLHFVAETNGFLCMMREEFYENMGNVGQRVGIYHVDRGDDLSDTYRLGDKDVSIAEAVEAAEKWLDENYADLEPEYDLRVKTVIARQNDYGEYVLDFTADHVYKGIEIDELNFVHYDDPEKENVIKFREYPIWLMTNNGTDIDYFSNITGIVTPIEKGTLDKVVSLKSALEYMEKTFADFANHMTINDINLKYVLTPDYDTSIWRTYNLENVMNTGHIVWEFVIDVPMEKYMHEENGEMVYERSSIGDVREYIYIDAETGEMDFEFDYNQVLQ